MLRGYYKTLRNAWNQHKKIYAKYRLFVLLAAPVFVVAALRRYVRKHVLFFLTLVGINMANM